MPDLNETAAQLLRAQGESEPTAEMIDVTSMLLESLRDTFEPANTLIGLDACRFCHNPTLNLPRQVGSGLVSVKCPSCNYVNLVRGHLVQLSDGTFMLGTTPV